MFLDSQRWGFEFSVIIVTLPAVLQRIQSPTGVVSYQSPLLNQYKIPHAFSTRLGGVSSAPFDSMNLGNPNGCAIQDLTPNIDENYRRLMQTCGLDGRFRCYTHQVHGGAVIVVPAGEEFINSQKADALVTDDPAKALSIRVADCVPVVLASRDGKVVACIHAGWRGVIARAVINALDLMHVPAGEILAAIGPSISFDHFEVGPEVLAEFTNAFGDRAPIRTRPDGKGHVDLRQAIRLQLTGIGVPDAQIESTDRCTVRDIDEFFSHRRDNGVTGRMSALIGPRRV